MCIRLCYSTNPLAVGSLVDRATVALDCNSIVDDIGNSPSGGSCYNFNGNVGSTSPLLESTCGGIETSASPAAALPSAADVF